MAYSCFLFAYYPLLNFPGRREPKHRPTRQIVPLSQFQKSQIVPVSQLQKTQILPASQLQ